MTFFQRRRYRKAIRHLLHEARHAMNMRGDVAEAPVFERVKDRAAALRAAWDRQAGEGELDHAMEEVEKAIQAIYPPRSKPRLRENLEIFVVAIAVAMAFRAYFIQPFKIPTGSMQPTLNGITMDPAAERQWHDRFPFSMVSLALFGERYVEVRAKDTGTLQLVGQRSEDSQLVFAINGKLHVVHQDMRLYFNPFGAPPVFNQGDLIASGRRQIGDHIFVNRMKYNFVRPGRGDVFVFSTRAIEHVQIRPDAFYIKRMVGLPHERIAIVPPYLVADGKRVMEPKIFQTILEAPGYHGYSLVDGTPPFARLTTPAASIQLGKGEYLAFGDNTRASLDSRYFGAVRNREIIGPAFWVYWPFTKRWGWIH
ncbi:MAG TPA: signal peptidase I [Kiritimatiellia bacterium]|nr:signal peptidase I [Kiritimatiellia bacterium]